MKIYTDGACSGNPGPGGWAIILTSETDPQVYSGYELATTNNRMELMAVTNAYVLVAKGKITDSEVTIYSDSAYVVNAINQNWLDSWEANGWRTAKGQVVKNSSLWQKLLKARTFINFSNKAIMVQKVKGHAGDTYNEYADMAARQEVEKARRLLGKNDKIERSL